MWVPTNSILQALISEVICWWGIFEPFLSKATSYTKPLRFPTIKRSSETTKGTKVTKATKNTKVTKTTKTKLLKLLKLRKLLTYILLKLILILIELILTLSNGFIWLIKNWQAFQLAPFEHSGTSLMEWHTFAEINLASSRSNHRTSKNIERIWIVKMNTFSALHFEAYCVYK